MKLLATQTDKNVKSSKMVSIIANFKVIDS